MRIDLVGDPSGSLARALARAGYAVHVAAGLPEEMEDLRQEHPSLIIVVDRRAPAVCRALRQVVCAPILALLPGANEADVIEALAAGADDCQSATIGSSELILRVRAVLGRAR